MAKTPHLVQYQGSKRNLAPQILQYMPQHFNRLIEPFSGTAAVSIASAQRALADSFVISDLNAPLIALLKEAVENPDSLFLRYEAIWKQQFCYGEQHVKHFYEVRKAFNRGEQTPENMLYLLARCVKGAVRYSKSGQFNQSPDKRRNGTNPQNVRKNAREISKLLKGKTVFLSEDYKTALKIATVGDIVYMDPPYQGVSGTKDCRYIDGLCFDEFVAEIENLDRRGIDYIISYDGLCGEKSYGREFPSTLGCQKHLLYAGLSSQSTLLGRRKATQEALYVSNHLLEASNRWKVQGWEALG